MKKIAALFCVCFVMVIVLLPRLVHADQSQSITVSAKIPARPTDFQVSIASKNATSPYGQGQTITYEITYGSTLSYATDVTIRTNWDVGTLKNQSSPTVELLQYVPGSATNAYGNTSPVIDLINRTIAWSIPQLPANTTNQTISFKVLVTSPYTGSNPVSFGVRAKGFNTDSNITIPENSISQTFQIAQQPKPTTTPSPSLSISPLVTPTPSVTISTVGIQSVVQNAAGIGVTLTQGAGITLRYGKSPGKLTSVINDTAQTLQHTIQISGLDPETTYYFTIITNANGKTIASDIYQFTTAAGNSVAPEINQDTVIITSNDNILIDPLLKTPENKNQKSIIVIPKDQTFAFKFSLKKYDTIKRVQMIIRNNKVLGASTLDTQDATNDGVDLIEISNGSYVGRVVVPTIPGSYEAVIRLSDTKGNITENSISNITVTEPMTVRNARTKQPIENAQILIYYFNNVAKRYTLLPQQIFPIKNPLYTDINGTIPTPLAQGKYKIQITAIGYGQKEIPFTLGNRTGETYPQAMLSEEPFNLLTLGTYYWTIVVDTLHASRTYVQGLSNSIRFFQLNALLATAFLVFLTLLSFSRRIHIPLHLLFSYFIHLGKIKTVQKKVGERVKGRVFGEQDLPLALARVYLIDENKHKILSHTETANDGNFSFIKFPNTSYAIEIMKDGYEPMVFHESDMQAVGLGGYLLTMQKHEKGISAWENTKIFSEKLSSLLFEALLIISVIFEISLGYALGWQKTLLFLVISLLNLLLWLIHMSHLRSEKNMF